MSELPVSKPSIRGIFRGKKERSFWYKIVRVITTTFIFTIIFYFVILSVGGLFIQWCLTVGMVAVSMILGSATARVFAHSTHRDEYNVQFFVRWVLVVSIYGTLIWIFISFGVYSKINFWQSCLIFTFTKFFVFILSDYLADRITFQH